MRKSWSCQGSRPLLVVSFIESYHPSWTVLHHSSSYHYRIWWPEQKSFKPSAFATVHVGLSYKYEKQSICRRKNENILFTLTALSTYKEELKVIDDDWTEWGTMNELRYLPNFDIHIGGSRESGRRPMGNGQIANRAICLKLVLCLQLVFIFR